MTAEEVTSIGFQISMESRSLKDVERKARVIRFVGRRR
jgi:hypothetical protein